MNTKFALHGSLRAQPGKSEDLAKILIRASELVSKLDDCHLYAVSQDNSSSNLIWITEIWDNKEAHANSLQLPEVRALIGEAMPLLDGQPEKGQQLTVLGGYMG